MAIGAAVGIQRLGKGIENAPVPWGMTLEAKKRHGGIEHPAVHGTVGRMAVQATLHDIAMLVNERTAHFHVTTDARVPLRYALEQFLLRRAVGFMAIKTTHPLLLNGVVREQAELGLYIGMAAIAEFGHLCVADFLLGSFMQFVAGGATQVVQGMDAGMPVGQRWGRGGRMTFQTDQGLGLGG